VETVRDIRIKVASIELVRVPKTPLLASPIEIETRL